MDNMTQNEYIRAEFESRRKTTGPAVFKDTSGSMQLPAVDTATFESSMEHSSVSSLKSIDKASNPLDGKAC